jgi:hypothetical protein
MCASWRSQYRVKWFNDCFLLFADPAALPDPSYVKELVGVP